MNMNMACTANVLFVVLLAAAFLLLLLQSAPIDEERSIADVAQGIDGHVWQEKPLPTETSKDKAQETKESGKTNAEGATNTYWDTLSSWISWASHKIPFNPFNIGHSREAKDGSSTGGAEKVKSYETGKKTEEDASEEALQASPQTADGKIKQTVGKSGTEDHNHRQEL